jgi:hypothetical protein
MLLSCYTVHWIRADLLMWRSGLSYPLAWHGNASTLRSGNTSVASIFMKEKDILGGKRLVWHKYFQPHTSIRDLSALMLILMLKSLDMRVFARTYLPKITQYTYTLNISIIRPQYIIQA